MARMPVKKSGVALKAAGARPVSAGERIIKSVTVARDGIKNIEIATESAGHPEVIGVRVWLSPDAMHYVEGATSYIESKERSLRVLGAAGELARFPFFCGAEMVFATKRRG